MMGDFVRLHMMSMLQPFAQSLGELQAQVQQLADAQRRSGEAEEQHSTRLDKHNTELSALASSTEEASQQLEKLQAELGAVKKERNRLEGNHEMTKASLAKAKEALMAVESSAETMRLSLAAGEERSASLEQALAALEKQLLERFDSRLDKQGRVCKELNEKQAEMQKTCQQAKTMSERANAAVNKISSIQESLKQEDIASFASLQECTTELHRQLLDVSEKVQMQAKCAAATEREVENLKTWTGRLGEVEELQTLQAETVAEVQALSTRLGTAEAHVAELGARHDPTVEVLRAELRSLEQRFSSSLAEASKAKGLSDSGRHCPGNLVVRRRSSSVPEIREVASQVDIAADPQSQLPVQRDIPSCRLRSTQPSPFPSPWQTPRQTPRQISTQTQVMLSPTPITPRSSLYVPGQSKATPRQVSSKPDFRMQQYALAIPLVQQTLQRRG